MCDASTEVGASPELATLGPSRRTVLLGAILGGTAAATGLWPTSADAESFLTKTPRIRPRSQWAGSSCPVRGLMHVERDGDVKVLLEHHSASSNSYTAAAVPGILRGFYRLHVDKGWPDVAYNFLVDRHGGIWEGRAGSAARPVVPSATGGTQGFSQIVCWIGDHRTVMPTAAAQQSMISMLAWLARKYGVRTDPGTTTTFVSRGSNRFPKGSAVRTRTIEGHRKMSSTACPGDAAYAIVRDRSQAEVTRLNRS